MEFLLTPFTFSGEILPFSFSVDGSVNPSSLAAVALTLGGAYGITLIARLTGVELPRPSTADITAC
ncbi:hypothetical protein D3C76_1465390 [compost metagenome]